MIANTFKKFLGQKASVNLADLVFGVEDLNNPDLETFRLDTCKACPFIDPDGLICKKCGCFMEAKTKLFTFSNHEQGGAIEFVCCPESKWNDAHVLMINQLLREQRKVLP